MVQTKKKIDWIRLSINGLKGKSYKEVMAYAQKVTKFFGCKYFFLFEHIPEFIIQLDYRDIKKVKEFVHKNKFAKIKVNFIESPEEKNPFAVKFYCLGAEFALWKALSGEYKDEYLFPNFVKLVHCLCNQQFANDRLERAFYHYCLANRQ